eukprot:NODE_20677_length_787_cov_3.824242.p2 GENE.NODE_20677_length_787_cov_3.824242~~NODE_20677_length_787_cov_3.824242.p2  ORF type:complete len:194 (+),score=34.34 NODE_20677_length_787_cov_3.824242:153-734(+)
MFAGDLGKLDGDIGAVGKLHGNPCKTAPLEDKALAEMYTSFMIGFTKGIRLMHIIADSRERAYVRCRLETGLRTMMIDDGVVPIAVPLKTVASLSRFTLAKDVRSSVAATLLPAADAATVAVGAAAAETTDAAVGESDYVVLVRFGMLHEYTFVFRSEGVARCFMACMQELVQRARQPKPRRLRNPMASDRGC